MSKATFRTLAVFATILMTSGAHAATLYNKDGLKYDIKGDIQIQLRKDPGTDMQTDVEYDDLEIKNKITYELENNMTAFAGLDFGFKNAADKSDSGKGPHLEEAFVGLGYGAYSVSVGKTTSAGDEFGIEMAYEEMIEDTFKSSGAQDGDDIIKFEGEFSGVTVIAAHEFAGKSKEGSAQNGRFSDIFISTNFAGLELGAAYQSYEEFARYNSTTGKPEFEDAVTIYGVSAAYNAKVIKIAADYSVAKDDRTILNVAASAPITKATQIAAGYVEEDFDAAGKKSVTGWYANVTHKLQKNVCVFAEVEDTDQKDVDMGYLAGMRVKF